MLYDYRLEKANPEKTTEIEDKKKAQRKKEEEAWAEEANENLKTHPAQKPGNSLT